MCECQKRFKSLLEDHRRCRSIVRPPMSRNNTPEPELIEPIEHIDPDIEPKPEFKDPDIVKPKSPIIILEHIKDEDEDEDEDCEHEINLKPTSIIKKKKVVSPNSADLLSLTNILKVGMFVFAIYGIIRTFV